MNAIQKIGVIGSAALCITGLYACAGTAKDINPDKTTLTDNIDYDKASAIKGMQDMAYAKASMKINKDDKTKEKMTSDKVVSEKSKQLTTVKSPEIAIQKKQFTVLLSNFIMSDCEDYLIEENKNY